MTDTRLRWNVVGEISADGPKNYSPCFEDVDKEEVDTTVLPCIVFFGDHPLTGKTTPYHQFVLSFLCGNHQTQHHLGHKEA